MRWTSPFPRRCQVRARSEYHSRREVLAPCDLDQILRIEHRRWRDHRLMCRDPASVPFTHLRPNGGMGQVKFAQLLKSADLNPGAVFVDLPNQFRAVDP